jgi:hypothetical protein
MRGRTVNDQSDDPRRPTGAKPPQGRQGRRDVDHVRLLWLPHRQPNPSVLLGTAGLNLAVAWERKGGARRTCMNPMACDLRENRIDDTPFKIDRAKLILIPAPADFMGDIKAPKITVLALVASKVGVFAERGFVGTTEPNPRIGARKSPRGLTSAPRSKKKSSAAELSPPWPARGWSGGWSGLDEEPTR